MKGAHATPSTKRITPAAYAVPSPARSRNMAAVKRSNTKPEVQLRTALHAAGYRYRKDFPIKFGRTLIRPDIAFTRHRVAVFVDGCFWHSCPQHGQTPATNKDFWTEKLRNNALRDREQDRTLTESGWVVVRIWEHEPLSSATAAVVKALGAQKAR